MGEIVRSTGVQGRARVRSLPGAANFSVPAMPVCKCEGPGAGRKSAGLEKSAVVAAISSDSDVATRDVHAQQLPQHL